MAGFGEYLATVYQAVCKMQRSVNEDHDAAMVAGLRTNQVTNAQIISWMRVYDLWRGVGTSDRTLVANRVRKFSREDRPRWFNTPAQGQQMFGRLHRKLAPNGERKWLSATSKLLWCLYPARIPMYDRFAHRSLVVLQRLEPALAHLPPLNETPQGRQGEDGLAAAERYGAHYGQYYAMVKALMAENEGRLKQLRVRHNESYPYDIRIIDKTLWLLGRGA